MKPESHTPLYGRLVHLSPSDDTDQGQSHWSWVVPWILALAAVGLTLLLSV